MRTAITDTTRCPVASPESTPWSEAAAQTIRERRSELGLSVETLAKRSGVNRVRLARIEDARLEPTLADVSKLALALEMDMGELCQLIEAIVFTEKESA